MKTYDHQLPVGYSINTPLLLLSTGDKQTEFCNWLLDSHEELTLVEREHYIAYLVMYELIENQEVKNKMSRKIGFDVDFLVDLVDRTSEGRDQFIRQLSQRGSPIKIAQAALQADSPMDAAQAMLQVDSPLSAAQAMLQVDSPLGVAQAALQTDSPEEAALKFIHSQEQLNRLLELYFKQNKTTNSELESEAE